MDRTETGNEAHTMCASLILVTHWRGTCRVHDDEEEHAVRVHRPEGAPVAREEGVGVISAHEEDSL